MPTDAGLVILEATLRDHLGDASVAAMDLRIMTGRLAVRREHALSLNTAAQLVEHGHVDVAVEVVRGVQEGLGGRGRILDPMVRRLERVTGG